MIKLSLTLSLVAILIACGLFFYFKNTSDLYYVDINKLIEKYDRTIVERNKYEKEVQKLNSNVDSLVTDWKMLVQKFEQNRGTLSSGKKDSLRAKLTRKQNAINNYQKTINKQIKKEEENAMQTVLNDINEYVKRYGKANDYRIIFGASGGGNIMYANQNADLTTEILKGLNKEFQKK